MKATETRLNKDVKQMVIHAPCKKSKAGGYEPMFSFEDLNPEFLACLYEQSAWFDYKNGKVMCGFLVKADMIDILKQNLTNWGFAFEQPTDYYNERFI